MTSSVFAICAAVCLAAFIAAAVANGASSTSTVSVTVPSATYLSVDPLDTPGGNCKTGTLTRTDFGVVGLNAKNVTSNDCMLVFGSSNNTAMLRARQEDGVGDAMIRSGWTQQDSGTGANLLDVDAVDDQNVWVGGENVVIRTTNGGTNWAPPANSPAPVWWFGVAATAPNSVWVAGFSGGFGNIWRTTDGGATPWTQVFNAAGIAFEGIDVVDGTTVGWAVADGGEIYSTINGTAWGLQVDTNDNWQDVEAYSTSVAWAIGGVNIVRRTTDGGATWPQTPALPVTAGNLRSIGVVDANTAYVGTETGEQIFKTVNAGASWVNVSVPSAPNNNITGIATPNDQTVFVVEGANPPGHIRLSSNAATTWSDISVAGNPGMSNVSAPDGAHAFAIERDNGAANTRIYAYPAGTVDDYDDVANDDWDNAATNIDLFGACLASIGSGASVVGADWVVDPGNNCGTTDADEWYPIPAAASTKIAWNGSSGDADAVANLRFGYRTSISQAPGVYLAQITFEVIAPNA
jgi:hypothetical protein